VHISSQASSPGKNTNNTKRDSRVSLQKSRREREREEERGRERKREEEREGERERKHTTTSDKRVVCCARCGVAFVVVF